MQQPQGGGGIIGAITDIAKVGLSYVEAQKKAEALQAEKDFIARQPMGRLATVEDISPMVVYLASDESRFVTGQIMLVDGGVTI